MIKLNSVLLVSCFCIAIVGCDKSSSTNEKTASIDRLVGNTFHYVVEREIEESSQYSIIDDSLYVEVEKGDEYEVEFSDDHTEVSINPGELIGILQFEEDDLLEYNIDEGYFAGGRFIVWIEDEEFYAELTEYGSGMPIIASGKGRLTKAK